MLFSEDKHLSFDRSHDSSFGKFQQIQEVYEERIGSLSKQLQVFFAEIENDEIFKAMQENSLSLEYASQRASELFNEIMKSEQENTIHRLQNDLVDYKTVNLKLEYENKKIVSSLRETEDRLRRSELEKEKVLRDYEVVASKLANLEKNYEESLKRKEAECMGNLRRLENVLQETDQKYYNSRKELEFSKNSLKANEVLQGEIEALRKELKSQENFAYQKLEEVRSLNEGKVADHLKENEILKSQFKNYQKQSEDLALNHQNVIKSLVEKSKQLKQKVISQKSKIGDFCKSSKEVSQSKSNLEKIINELEEKVKSTEKEAAARESEIHAKHQSQITQLQMQYQRMMEVKLSEMQDDVDRQISKSQEYDKEVKALMELKMKEIEREYILLSAHEQVVAEKENELSQKFGKRLEGKSSEYEQNQNELKREIVAFRKENEELSQTIENLQKAEEALKKELLKEKERLGSELTAKLLKVKESETSRIELGKELEKAKKQLESLTEGYNEEALNRMKIEKELNSTISDLQNSLIQAKQALKSTKVQFELELSEKVDKSLYFKEKEKSQYLEQEINNKAQQLSKLENEFNSLQGSLRESMAKHSGDLDILELEQSRLDESKKQIKDLENYSKNLLNEIEIRESQQSELSQLLDRCKQEIKELNLIIENKEKDYFALKQSVFAKESELRYKHKNSLDRLKKYLKNSVFFLKKQLQAVAELFEHEYCSINKTFSAVISEVSLKIIESQLHYRKEIDYKSETFTSDVKLYYKSRFAQLEEFISSENIHWNDSETEGIRRAVKAIIEKKNIAQIEIKSLRESLASLTEQNEGLYRENQKLQIRLHANNEAFDQLQREVSEEANKIKSRLDLTEYRGSYFRS